MEASAVLAVNMTFYEPAHNQWMNVHTVAKHNDRNPKIVSTNYEDLFLAARQLCSLIAP